MITASLGFQGLGIFMAILFGLALIILAYLALAERGKAFLYRMAHRFTPERFKPNVERMLHSFFEGLHALRSPFDLVVASVASVGSWMLEATMYYMVARAFNIDEPFYVFLLLTAAANLVIAVVATQGGVGPFELVVSRTVVAFGAAEELASAYAIGLHALLLFPIIVLGLYLMWSMKLTFGDILQQSRFDDEGPPAETIGTATNEPAVRRATIPSKPAVEGSGGK